MRGGEGKEGRVMRRRRKGRKCDEKEMERGRVIEGLKRLKPKLAKK